MALLSPPHAFSVPEQRWEDAFHDLNKQQGGVERTLQPAAQQANQDGNLTAFLNNFKIVGHSRGSHDDAVTASLALR